MRSVFTNTLLAIFLMLLFAPSTYSSEIDDKAVCDELVRRRQAGLYIAYPLARNNGNLLRSVRANDPLQYDASARMFFVSGERQKFTRRQSTRVWHVKTQTTARFTFKNANQAFVWRPPLRTHCSPDTGFPSFDENSRFVSVNRYIDHHLHDESGRRSDLGLSQNFHFEFRPASRRSCIRTDDPVRIGDLEAIYGFEKMQRSPNRLAGLTVSSPGTAGDATRYAGFSSEFVYKARPTAVCFSFAVPLPTESSFFSQIFTRWRHNEAQQRAKIWRPTTTTVVIRSIPSGRIERFDVMWAN